MFKMKKIALVLPHLDANVNTACINSFSQKAVGAGYELVVVPDVKNYSEEMLEQNCTKDMTDLFEATFSKWQRKQDI